MATPVVERPLPGPLTAPESATRMVPLRANLLPDEIVSARSADAMRRKVLVGLAGVVALLVLWFGLSWWQTGNAEDELSSLQEARAGLQRSTAEYAPLVSAQGETKTINDHLARLMTGDLSWQGMLATLASQAPAGVSLDQVTGQLTTGVATAGTSGNGGGGTSFDVLDGSATNVGKLTISGSAPNKSAIAAYADQLAKVAGLTPPVITSFTTRNDDVSFTLATNITSAALGGKYTKAAAPAAKGGN